MRCNMIEANEMERTKRIDVNIVGNMMIIKWVAMILWALSMIMLLKIYNGNDES